MFHRVVLLRKRTIAIVTFLLLAATAFMRWRATSGYWPWVFLGAGLFPLAFMTVYWVRGRMKPFLLVQSSRAEVDRLFSEGAGRKSKLRALRFHLEAYEVHERKTGSVNLSLYVYWKHLQVCIKECKRPELPLRLRRVKAVDDQTLNPVGVIDGFEASDVIGVASKPVPYPDVRKTVADNQFGEPSWGENHGRKFD